MEIKPGDRVRIDGAPVTVNPYKMVSVSGDGQFAELASGAGAFRFSERMASLVRAGA